MQHTAEHHQGTCGPDAACAASPRSACASQPHHHAGPHHHHGHQHGHSHTHHHGGGTRAMAIAMTITAGLMVLEVIGGIVTGSLALLADAGHMLTDVAALGLSLGAAWLMRRPATSQRTFGFHRAEILAALINGISLVALSAYVVYEALTRLQAPPTVDSEPLLVIATLGLLANLVSGWVLMRSSGENLNVRSAYLHVLSDALGSVGAILAGILMYAYGWYLADPLLSIAISILIMWGAWRLLRDTVNILLEAAPAWINVAEVRRTLDAVPGVDYVHDLHIWSVASNFVALSGHVRLEHAPSCAEHQRLLVELRRLLHSRFGIEHVTLQLEEPHFNETELHLHTH